MLNSFFYFLCFIYYDVAPRSAALSSSAQTLGSWVRIPLDAYISVRVSYVFMLFCVQVAALLWAYPPSKESYRLMKN
jgi:hypothetical protein